VLHKNREIPFKQLQYRHGLCLRQGTGENGAYGMKKIGAQAEACGYKSLTLSSSSSYDGAPDQAQV
jgi:hypothetical protein